MEQTMQIKRAYELLKDGEFSQADTLFAAAVTDDPKNADALLGRLLVILKCTDESELVKQSRSFAKDPYYLAAYSAADDAMKERLDGYCAQVNINAAELRYQRAKEIMENASNPSEFDDAAYWFGAALQYVPDYKDAVILKEQCLQKEGLQVTVTEQPQEQMQVQQVEVTVEQPFEEPVKKEVKVKNKKNIWNFLWLLLSLPFVLIAVAGFVGYDGSLAGAAIFGVFFIPAAMFLMLFMAPAGSPYLSQTKKGLKKWHLPLIALRTMWLVFGLYLEYAVILDTMINK